MTFLSDSKMHPTSTDPSVIAQARFRFRWVGLLTGALYLLTLIFYFKGPQSHSRMARELFTWFLVPTCLLLFWKGYQIVNGRNEPPIRMVVGFGMVFCLLAFFIFPFHSPDVFGYINLGWQQVHYHQNPYVYFTSDIPAWQQDPMLTRTWMYIPSAYGFLFTLIARVLTRLGNGNLWLTLFLFKGLNVLAYGATSWLVWSAARRLDRAKPLTDLYLFMWNPLVLLHHVGNGHNDILTGFFLALAFYLAIVGAGFWIIPLLVLATLLKYGPAILIPLALVFVIKNYGWKKAILSCLLAGGIFVVVAGPYVLDWQQFRFAEMKQNATFVHDSLHSFLIYIFESIAQLVPPLSPWHDLVNELIKAVLRLGLIIFLLAQILTIPKHFTATVFIRKSLLAMFVLIFVASSKFYAWYLGMLLPLALFTDPRYWLRRLVVLISGSELFSLTFLPQAHMLNYFAMVLVPAGIVSRQVARERKEESDQGRADNDLLRSRGDPIRVTNAKRE